MSLETVLPNINPLAVLAAGFAHMATGLIWFSPKLFGRQWADLTKEELKPARQWLIVGLIGHLVIAFVLALVVHLAHATTIVDGILVGVLMWAGFIVTLETGELIWEKIPFGLFAIRVGNHFVALSLAGAILAVCQ